MAKTYTVPYVNVRVVRDPMCVQTKQVPAHEVFVLMGIFQEVHVVGPALTESGKPITRVVEADLEYQRLAAAYGSNSDNDTPRVTETFGPPHSSAWIDALKNGLDNFDMSGDEDGKPPAPEPPKHDALMYHIQRMMLQDSQKAMDDWWVNDGRPEVAELRQRMGGEKVSAAERDAAYQAVMADIGEGAGTGNGQQINIEAVMAQLDDIEVEYDPDASPEDLVGLLHASTISQIQALGGEPADGASLEDLSAQLVGLRQQQE